MSQVDFDIATGDANTGITFRAAVNAALQALASVNSGASAPTTPYPFQIYINTTDVPAGAYIRNAANTAWVKFGYVDAGTGKLMLYNADTAASAAAAPWTGITGKPATFPPDAHNQDGSTISGGTLGNTVVPLSRMQRTEMSGKNTSVVTVPAITWTDVAGINLGSVVAGDRIPINAFISWDTPMSGEKTIMIRPVSGTASIQFYHDSTNIAGTTPTYTNEVSGIGKVTASGTLQLVISAFHGSSGSATIAIGNAQIHAIVLNNG